MVRIPIDQEQIQDSKVVISGNDFKHIVKVLRLNEGDSIILFSPDSYEYNGVITDVESKQLVVEIKSKKLVSTESPIDITLYQGLAKGSKMDLIVEKATELGVKKIVPVVTERSQIKDTKKVKRWKRIVTESSKQCRRTNPPEVAEITDFNDATESINDGVLQVILYEGYDVLLKDYLRNYSQETKAIAIFIGPEGGFSKNEIDLAVNNGFTALGLGPRILRTETASLVTLSILQHHFGDI